MEDAVTSPPVESEDEATFIIAQCAMCQKDITETPGKPSQYSCCKFCNVEVHLSCNKAAHERVCKKRPPELSGKFVTAANVTLPVEEPYAESERKVEDLLNNMGVCPEGAEEIFVKRHLCMLNVHGREVAILLKKDSGMCFLFLDLFPPPSPPAHVPHTSKKSTRTHTLSSHKIPDNLT